VRAAFVDLFDLWWQRGCLECSCNCCDVMVGDQDGLSNAFSCELASTLTIPVDLFALWSFTHEHNLDCRHTFGATDSFRSTHSWLLGTTTSLESKRTRSKHWKKQQIQFDHSFSSNIFLALISLMQTSSRLPMDIVLRVPPAAHKRRGAVA
jgi:hypothetical protein